MPKGQRRAVSRSADDHILSFYVLLHSNKSQDTEAIDRASRRWIVHWLEPDSQQWDAYFEENWQFPLRVGRSLHRAACVAVSELYVSRKTAFG
jgi:hypothetical protein